MPIEFPEREKMEATSRGSKAPSEVGMARRNAYHHASSGLVVR
jgi:hypothetical protein